MTNTMTIRALPQKQSSALAAVRGKRRKPQSHENAARSRARRRKALLNTLVEALATIGLGTCFILCAVLVICVA